MTLCKCAAAVFVCLTVGGISGFATRDSVSGWYTTLTRPPLNPPARAFGIVWPVLYVLMGIAAGLVWARGLRAPGVKTALSVFGVQLLLNGLWSPLFFGLHWIGTALIEIVLLWAAIVWTVVLFRKVSAAAGVLLWPYLAWVTFAVYLNAGYWVLNR